MCLYRLSGAEWQPDSASHQIIVTESTLPSPPSEMPGRPRHLNSSLISGRSVSDFGSSQTTQTLLPRHHDRVKFSQRGLGVGGKKQ
jgi:hypothetical protein